MKYFNPSYWFKLWVLTAPLFNDKKQGINAKSIDNKKIKDWASNNTNLQSINQDMTFTNSSINYQSYNLTQSTNKNIDPFYQTYLDSLASEELETSIHKHRHEKRRHKESRNKRQPNPQRSKEIFQLNERLIINQNNSSQYINSFQSIVEQLTNNNILRRVINLQRLLPSIAVDRIVYSLNSENYGYFRLPVQIRGEQNGQSFFRNLELVFRTDNLYLQGFTVNNNYYHFNFNNVNMNMQPQAVRDGSVPLLIRIPNFENHQLNNIGPDYRDMMPRDNTNINWENIFNSFLTLTNDINVDAERIGEFAQSLFRIIFITAEALRFTNIFNIVCDDIIRQNNNVLVRFRNNQIYQVLVSWGRISRQYTNLFNSENQLSRSAEDLLIYSIVGLDNPELFFGSLIPIENITNSLENFNIRVLLTRTIRPDNCNNREKRDVINKFWHEKFCDLKPQSEKIQGKINDVKILDENTKGGNLQVGDIYVGTENGVYLIHGTSNQVDRFDNLNFPIKDIILDGNGSAYVINDKCEIYHLNLIGWGSEKTNTESCDLNKELKLYYDKDKKNQEVYFESTLHNYKNYWINTFNLGPVNPLDYNKITFLGDVDKDCWGVSTHWGSWVYDNIQSGCYESTRNRGKNVNQFLQTISKNILKDVIKNKKISDKSSWDEIKESCAMEIQGFTDWDGSANIWSVQRVGLSFYWENYNYFLQVFTYQYLEWWASEADLKGWIKLGNGIRLYNDDNIETQIPNPNDRKKREIFEEKNITKWTDEFTKYINNEQHLPLTNNTNFVASNVTSL